MESRPGRHLRQLIAVALTLGLAGCAALTGALTGNNQDNRIAGSVWYKERMMLPPDAQIQVTLENISQADAPAAPIASTRFRAKEAPPWNFVLTYDPELIQARDRYSLKARITRNDKLLFASTDANLVFPADSSGGSHRIRVSRIEAAFADSKARMPASDQDLAGISWQLSWIDGDTIDTGAAAKPLNIVFVEDDERVHGYAGCNSFTGGYHQTGKQLTVDTLAVTSMECGDGMAQEQTFLKALKDTTKIQIRDNELRLLDEDGKQMLRFKAGTAL